MEYKKLKQLSNDEYRFVELCSIIKQSNLLILNSEKISNIIFQNKSNEILFLTLLDFLESCITPVEHFNKDDIYDILSWFSEEDVKFFISKIN